MSAAPASGMPSPAPEQFFQCSRCAWVSRVEGVVSPHLEDTPRVESRSRAYLEYLKEGEELDAYSRALWNAHTVPCPACGFVSRAFRLKVLREALRAAAPGTAIAFAALVGLRAWAKADLAASDLVGPAILAAVMGGAAAVLAYAQRMRHARRSVVFLDYPDRNR